MLIVLTILIMGVVAYAFLTEGLSTGSIMCINTLIAGMVAFNFWEPIASAIEGQMVGSDFAEYLDAICLVTLFCVTFGILRLITNSLQPFLVDLNGVVHGVGGAFFGLVTGYLAAGFLICVLQTLPVHRQFMGFDPQVKPAAGMRAYLPPDRVWLALMQYAGSRGFASESDEKQPGPKLPEDVANSMLDRSATFDRYGSFEVRYARYRRFGDNNEKIPYNHEFDAELKPRR